jgi:hypothetical protein
VFLLDILSHRMSVIAILRLLTRFASGWRTYCVQLLLYHATLFGRSISGATRARFGFYGR